VQGIGMTGLQLKSTELVRPVNAHDVATTDVFRVFSNMSWLGDQGPEQFYSYPQDVQTPWAELFAAKLNRSVYFGMNAKPARSPVLRLELIPSNSQTVREDGNWPRPSELKGEPVGVSLCFADFANAPPGKTYQAPPVLLLFHDGDWRATPKPDATQPPAEPSPAQAEKK
jgi:hypothetical protein